MGTEAHIAGIQHGRGTIRWQVEAKVHLLTSDGADTLLISHDWSSTGVFLRTRHPLPVGTRATLTMVLPGTNQQARWGAVVTRVVRDGERSHDRPPGIGLRFIALPGVVADFLESEGVRLSIKGQTTPPQTAPDVADGEAIELDMDAITRGRKEVAGDLVRASTAVFARETWLEDKPAAAAPAEPPAHDPEDGAFDASALLHPLRATLVLGGTREARANLAADLDTHGFDVALADTTEELSKLIDHGLSPEIYIVLPSEHGAMADHLRALATERRDMQRPRAVVVLGDVPPMREGTAKHTLLFAGKDTTAEGLRTMLAGLLTSDAAAPAA